MIGYTCKYTPVELLAALGGQPALLNREANAFSHAEALTHNHFCCHAKAVLEECRRDGVRELVLVNCCDSIRRCYDVLRAQGGLDFLFLLDLPHHDDGCAKARLRGELERLAAEYGAYRGATLDEAALRAAFTPPVPLPDGPFLAVTGARAGAGLLEALRRVSPLPVADLTCGGNRSLPPPPEGLDGLDGLLDELYTVADCGCGVLDVTVEHPVYGQLSGQLQVFSRYDADVFWDALQKNGAQPLCSLTGDIHLHTLVCPDEARKARVLAALEEKGYLMGLEK